MFIRCADCGINVLASATFCPRCGRLKPARATSIQIEQSSALLITGLIVLALGATAVGIFAEPLRLFGHAVIACGVFAFLIRMVFAKPNY